jgi:hypothetical protein
MNPARNIASFFFKTQIKIILLFTTEDFQVVLSFSSGLHIKSLRISLLPHARLISCHFIIIDLMAVIFGGE